MGGGGQLSCSHTLRAGSPVLPTTGSALVCYQGGVQGPFSCVLRLVRDRVSALSRSLSVPKLAPLPATGSKQCGGGMLFLVHAHFTWKMQGVGGHAATVPR